MSEPGGGAVRGAGSGATPGPTVSFGFNLGRIPDQGEDSDPILRIGRDLGLVGVFDGMGGAGGTVYATPEGPRTGAYLASRVARDVVERRMVDLLEPDWYLDGRAAAQDIRRAVKAALEDRLTSLDAPKSGLRSRLLRALPTTMALAALQRTQPGGDRWACHVFWAGDSRAYVFEPDGARQISSDDLRDPGDAMENLRHDSVVGNAMSADTEFEVRYRKVELRAPFLLACATDGCFGYVRSPMHFEHLVLSHLRGARSAPAWSAALQAQVTAVTGDDAAMSLLAVGADLPALQRLFAPRVAALEEEYLAPLDAAVEAVAQAEAALEALRRQQVETTAAVWRRYKPAYERYLHQSDEPDVAEPDVAEPDVAELAGDEPEGTGAADDGPPDDVASAPTPGAAGEREEAP